MFLLAVLIVALATTPLAGGRLDALGDLRVRWPWAAGGAIVVQILVISVFPDRFEAAHEPLHLLSYALAAAFVGANLRLPGVALVGLGGGLNLLAITANEGVMPATAAAQRAAGVVATQGEFANSAVLENPKLLFLGDVFYIPEAVPILNNTFSVGDILIAIGTFVLIHGVCGSRLVPAWAGGQRRTATPEK